MCEIPTAQLSNGAAFTISHAQESQIKLNERKRENLTHKIEE